MLRAWKMGQASTALGLLLICSMQLGGCDLAGYMLYLGAPGDKTEKVPAEYKGLVGKTVAIVIFTDQEVQYEYPYARLNLSAALQAELKNHIKKVSVIDPRRVIKYQDENINWETLEKTKLGQVFGADAVLYVVLDEYRMREPGSVNLYRGQISGQATVFKTASPEREARVWHGDDFRVLYPLHAPTGQPGHDDSQIRYRTEKLFAGLLVKKFYKHEVPKSE